MIWRTKRLCPYCHESMKATATVCPHCTRDVKPVRELDPMRVVFLAFIAWIAFQFAKIASGSDHSRSAPTDASATASAARPVAELPINYQEIATQGMVHFVVMPKGTGRQRSAYQSAIAHLCRGETHCEIIFWDNAKRAARALPMTDRQVNAEIAVYTLNAATNYEELQFIKNGEPL